MFSFAKKTPIEAEVLKYVGQPYIIFSEKGDFLRGHPKVSEILWNLGLGENDMQNRSTLIAGLKSQEMSNYDDAARQILHEQILLEDTTNFSGISEFEGVYILSQVKDTKSGSYAIFKDVTNDYMLLSAGNRLSFDTTTMLGVLQNLPCGVLICDARNDEFPVLCTNVSFLKNVSAVNGDIQDKPFLEILSRYFYHRDLYNLAHNFVEKYEPFSLVIERHDNGFYQWIRLSGYPVANENGAPVYFVVTAEDLTAVKIRQAQENQSYKMEMLGQLSSGIAHDFNNMLSVVEGYARMIKKDSSDAKQVVKQTEYILESVNKSASLTRQILNYGKQVRMKPEVINLGDVIYELKPLFKPLLNETINLSIDVAENAYVRCAPDHMTQVLMNLVVNARDAMEDKGGKLSISLSFDGNGNILLSVADEGCGMSEEVKSRIFDPYYTTKNNNKGTGLGMSTVQSLVKKMGADIQIQSEENTGTIISLIIPLSKEIPKVNDDGNRLVDKSSPLSGLIIMIVEDNHELLDSMSHTFKGYGAKVLAADNGNRALEIQENYEGEIDVLLTDIVMPELNGVKFSELFEVVRPKTKIIFVSGYPQSGHSSPSEAPSNMPFLQKPIEYEKLLQIINKECNLDFKKENLTHNNNLKSEHINFKNSNSNVVKENLYSIAGNIQNTGSK